MKNVKHFLSITDLNAKEIWHILNMAKTLKKTVGKFSSSEDIATYLYGKKIVLLFEKPSLRTKLSFDIAINQLGGYPIYFSPQEVGLGKRESVSDIAKVISSMADGVVARVNNHTTLKEFASNSKIPLINALSDLEHPCQILADLFTIWEIKGKMGNLTLSYIGDGENNVTHSLALGCALLGINFKCASPKGFWMDKNIVKRVKVLALETGAEIMETDDPQRAAQDADIIYTDTWISMGDEENQKERLKIFKPYQVSKKLMGFAKNNAIFMHDMPAYRGNEVTTDVIDGLQSVIFQQAENRLHAQKALLIFLLQKGQMVETHKTC